MILCGRSARHLYLANHLSECCEPLAIVHELGLSTAGKIRKLFNVRAMSRKCWRWLRDRSRYIGASESRYFFGDAEPKLNRQDLLHEYSSVNDPRLVELAKQLSPDFIAVFGTSLIRSDLLSQSRLGVVNLHGGLSPEYRGADCTFWALYNGEPEKVGCTLHYIDKGIDTGKLIAHVCPEVTPGDDELPLFWRAVRDSADVYGEFLQRATAGEPFGVTQWSKGKLYQVKDRLLRHELNLRNRLKKGVLIEEALPARVRWYQSSAPGE